MQKYILSRDYGFLFNWICEGNIAAGFVDYSYFGDDEVISRDIVQIERYDDYHVFIGVRGICSGNIYPYMKNKKISEQQIFINICEGLNLEFIKPKITD